MWLCSSFTGYLLIPGRKRSAIQSLRPQPLAVNNNPGKTHKPSKTAIKPRVAQIALPWRRDGWIGCSDLQSMGCFTALNRHRKFLTAKKNQNLALTYVSAASVR